MVCERRILKVVEMEAASVSAHSEAAGVAEAAGATIEGLLVVAVAGHRGQENCHRMCFEIRCCCHVRWNCRFQSRQLESRPC